MLPATGLRALLLGGLGAATPPPFAVRCLMVSADLCSTLPPSKHNRPRTNSPARPRPQSTLALPNTREDLNNKQSPAPSPPSPAAPRQVVRRAPKVPSLVSPDPFSNQHLPKLNVQKFRNTSSSALSIYSYQRKIKSKKISKYIELLSPIPEEGTYSQVQRKKNRENRPLALLYPWLMAEKKHVDKYTRLYTDLGIDVLKVTITPMDLLRPVPRAQVAAEEVLEYLLDNPEWNKLLIHGLSVGAYGFMEVMTKMEANEDRYLRIRPRFIGQVWDSPCDLPGLKEGVARSISNSRAVQERIMMALDWFLNVRYEAATRHYVKTQDMYHKNYCNSSSLFMYSRADPVSEPTINTDLANNWHEFGFEVFSKIFNESQHVGHYPKYKAEYTAHIHAYLEHIGMLRYAGINLED